MDRQGLRQRVYRYHAEYDKERGRSTATCPLTGEALVDGWDLHEVFVKRNEVPPKHQGLIMVVENCIPLQHEAHIEMGNTREALRKCIDSMFKNVGPSRIGYWYRDLWKKHGLSVDKGILRKPKHMKVRELVPLIKLGALAEGVSLPSAGWEYKGKNGRTDIRAQVALRMQRKRRKWKEDIPESHNGYHTERLYTWMEEGLWIDYLTKTLGIQWPC
jgi:hypothetical protein